MTSSLCVSLLGLTASLHIFHSHVHAVLVILFLLPFGALQLNQLATC